MAQTYEYPMFSPNEKAKLYKRLTNDMPIEIANGEKITVQGNRYAYIGKFRWVEHTEKQDGDEQPLDGLIINNSYLTIKTNSLMKFSEGDIIKLPDDTPFAGYWIITEGQTTDYAFTPKRIQRYQYLPLSSVGLG